MHLCMSIRSGSIMTVSSPINRRPLRVLLPVVAAAIALVGCSTAFGAGSSGSGSRAASSAPGVTTDRGSRSSGASPSKADASRGTKRITIVVGGDDLPQDSIIAAAHKVAGGSGYDFKPIFAAIKPLVSSADLALCQMEGTLSPDNTNLTNDAVSSGLKHHGPREFARDLAWAGYDGCSTSNNHTFDWGIKGLADTRTVMAAYGMKAAGPGPDAATPGQPAMYDVKGVKIAHLSYSYNLANGPEYPAAAPWLKANTLESHTADGIVADARAARAAGASVVLVSMHWGKQFVVQPSNEQTTFANAVLRSGAVDQIIGNHPHVVQPCQRINGRIVNYAFGNQVSDQRAGYPPATSTHPGARSNAQDGVIGKFTFVVTDGKVANVTGQYQVTRTDIPAGWVIRLVSKTSNPTAWTETTNQLISLGDSCKLTPLS